MPLPIRRHAEGPCPGAVTVVLEQPGKPVVVLDRALIERLDHTLDLVPSDCTGLVLASASERVFVAGADLKAIQDLTDPELHEYLAYGSGVFAKLASFPFPTAAAINGAALGGGLEIAMHCDALIASKPPTRDGQPGRPYPVGLPETGLSICPGWGGTNLLPARIDPAEAIRRTASGKPFTFDEAVDLGLFDTVVETAADLDEAALRWVNHHRDEIGPRDGAPYAWIGRPKVQQRVRASVKAVRDELPKTASADAVFDAVLAGLDRGWPGALEAERRHLVALRHTPEAVAAITAFFAKSGAPKA